MVNAENNVKTTPAATSQCYRYNHTFATRSAAHDVLSTWRRSPGWIVPSGYADYSCVNPGPDGFYIDVNISPNLHAGDGCNSYLMAATC